jgi:hypothetical protein
MLQHDSEFGIFQETAARLKKVRSKSLEEFAHCLNCFRHVKSCSKHKFSLILATALCFLLKLNTTWSQVKVRTLSSIEFIFCTVSGLYLRKYYWKWNVLPNINFPRERRLLHMIVAWNWNTWLARERKIFIQKQTKKQKK